MPEMPEVQGLVEFLGGRVVGTEITRATVAAIAALKTYDPPIDALRAASITGVTRHGKFVDVATDAAHLVFHLAKAGWLRWYDALPSTIIKPGRTPIALRVALSDGSGFDLTEAGTKKSLAVYVVRDPADVPGIARLGPDPLDDGFTREAFAALLAGKRTQIKGLLRDQSVIAGIGNAYSDEILHLARMSPYKPAAMGDEDSAALYAALRTTLRDAVARTESVAATELKAEKRANLRVHGRFGEPCPVCGDRIQQVIFADRTFQYCPTCQTGGKKLSDRVLDRLLT